jgi:hypothetical protein
VGRGAWGTLSSSMARRIAAVTAACSLSVRSNVRMARIYLAGREWIDNAERRRGDSADVRAPTLSALCGERFAEQDSADAVARPVVRKSAAWKELTPAERSGRW